MTFIRDLLSEDYQPARTVLLLSDEPVPPRFALPVVARSYATEAQLLDAFVATVRVSDPDIIVGWEVQGSSVGYLMSRHARLRPRALPLSAMLGTCLFYCARVTQLSLFVFVFVLVRKM